MFEVICALLLRLYPASFRRRYEAEALHLVRERVCRESGAMARARLALDLVRDVVLSMPGAHIRAWAARRVLPVVAGPGGMQFSEVGGTGPGLAPVVAAVLLSLAVFWSYAGIAGRAQQVLVRWEREHPLRPAVSCTAESVTPRRLR